jgi:hypothetical protein
MLDPFSRGMLAAVAALCVTATLALAPIRARSSVEALVVPALPVALANGDTVAVLDVRRDPFDQPVTGGSIAPTAYPRTVRSTPGDDTAVEPLPATVANLVVPAMPASATDQAGTGTRVTAVVTGAHPYALIDIGGVHSIEGLGDRVGTHTISAIDIDGVRLNSGERLRVDPETAP